ncbi:DUF3870 domain-containing protein [Gudongella sp. DL1XJH-153]|uniref:DUF3870 domain-containing protein n=1 Tax=Gudongella sp. DL1XJH-153 TaxID=3409804 RepID=UPI003BB70762
MKYSKNTIYVSSYAKLPVGTPSENVYKSLDIGLIISTETGIIENASVTLLTDVAAEFLINIVVGFNIYEDNLNVLLDEIGKRYHGSAQKAIMVAIKKAVEKYESIISSI